MFLSFTIKMTTDSVYDSDVLEIPKEKLRKNQHPVFFSTRQYKHLIKIQGPVINIWPAFDPRTL